MKILNILIIFNFINLLNCLLYSSFNYNNYSWILTPSYINHYNACKINNLTPTLYNENIEWNYNIMKNVVNGLNLNIKNNSNGIFGCCVSGLWCSNTECFTQSLESNFVNYYSIHPIDLYTVYTCQLKSNINSKVSIEKIQIVDQKLQISGNNFSINENNIDAIVGNSPCTNIENCHTVCQSCEGRGCQKDNACVLVGSTYSCLMFCSGPSDLSCPCGTLCQHVNVYITQSTYISTHFCAPKGLSCNNYVPSTINQFECETPRIYKWVNDSIDSNNISPNKNLFDTVVSVDKLGVNDLPVEINLQSCTSTNQCKDNSPYTSDTCYEGKCLYQQIESIGSISKFIRERNTPFTYLMFFSNNMTKEHDLFEARVRLDGTLLTQISNVDDVPQQNFKFGFSFNYFGNKVKDISINPNGLITFPPFVNCQALSGTFYCPVYGTGTNTISIWGSDWDLRIGGDTSTVHIFNQTKNENNYEDLYGINANAFHILYSLVYKFEQGTSRSGTSKPSTFSLSIYDDNSIRIRYHSILSKKLSTDVYGLWGSRASNINLHGNKYHEEGIDEKYVQSGNDITFCYISTIACINEAIAYNGSIVRLLVNNAPTCLALGENLNIKCLWLGQGSNYESNSFIEIINSKVYINCNVPDIDVDDNTLISLDLNYHTTKSSIISSLQGGKKSIISKYYNKITGELTNSHVMVRYFHSSSSSTLSSTTTNSYGCNPLKSLSSSLSSSLLQEECDLCGVCGGNNSYVDCHGECFGSAYIDSCGVCAGGSTNMYPDSSCNLSSYPNDWNDGNLLDTLSKTILLLTMMVCMTFIFSACMRIIRASFLGSEEDQHDGLFGLGLPNTPQRRENGLTRFEIDALGQIQFIKNAKDSCNVTTIDTCSDIESSSSPCLMTMPLQSNLECSICLIEFNENDRCRQLPCDHIFHTTCIDQWFGVSVLCPMCKRNIHSILIGDDDIPIRQQTYQYRGEQHQQQQHQQQDYQEEDEGEEEEEDRNHNHNHNHNQLYQEQFSEQIVPSFPSSSLSSSSSFSSLQHQIQPTITTSSTLIDSFSFSSIPQTSNYSSTISPITINIEMSDINRNSNNNNLTESVYSSENDTESVSLINR